MDAISFTTELLLTGAFIGVTLRCSSADRNMSRNQFEIMRVERLVQTTSANEILDGLKVKCWNTGTLRNTVTCRNTATCWNTGTCRNTVTNRKAGMCQSTGISFNTGTFWNTAKH